MDKVSMGWWSGTLLYYLHAFSHAAGWPGQGRSGQESCPCQVEKDVKGIESDAKEWGEKRHLFHPCEAQRG